MAPTRTRSPGLKSLTLLPTSWTMPTASCPRVRFSRGPTAPPTVWESEVQIRALVVLTIASFGPGWGMGFSMKPTWPIDFMISFHACSFLCFVASACIRRITGRSHIPQGNIVYRFPISKNTLVPSRTDHSKPLFRHRWITMCRRQSEQEQSYTCEYNLHPNVNVKYGMIE